MRLAEGTINFRVRELREGDVYEVDTPNLAFTVTQAGAFRVDVNENGDGTIVTVLRGEGEVIAEWPDLHQSMAATLANSTARKAMSAIVVASAPEPDDFDRWALEPRPQRR